MSNIERGAGAGEVLRSVEFGCGDGVLAGVLDRTNSTEEADELEEVDRRHSERGRSEREEVESLVSILSRWVCASLC